MDLSLRHTRSQRSKEGNARVGPHHPHRYVSTTLTVMANQRQSKPEAVPQRFLLGVFLCHFCQVREVGGEVKLVPVRPGKACHGLWGGKECRVENVTLTVSGMHSLCDVSDCHTRQILMV